MSCRTTAGGSASTSLARATTKLTDHEIQWLFHALKREGFRAARPSELDMQAWRYRQEELLDRMSSMSESKKNSIRARLYRSRAETTPDGATFYAWSRIEGRARQEIAIRSITTAIDLDPPGSQADQYDLDEKGRPATVWYASYGSNLHEERFLTYLQGGTPQGSTRTYPGCSDPTAPTGDIPIRWAGRPHFALTSRVWGGGIAFMDAAKDAQGLGRAYKITADQFDQIVHFENSGMTAAGAAPIDLDNVLTTGRLTTGPGAYETMVHIGDHDGVPVLTFTAPFSTTDAISGRGRIRRGAYNAPVRTTKPSASYVRMIGQGLGQTFGMDEVAQADYIRGCPGGDQWERRDLVKMLRAPELPPEPKPVRTRKGSTTADAWDTRLGDNPTLPLLNPSDLFSDNPHPPSAGSLAAAGVNPNRVRQPTEPRNHRNPRGLPAVGDDDTANTPAPRIVINIPTRAKDGNYFQPVAQYTSVTAQTKGIRRWQVCADAQQAKLDVLSTKLANLQRHTDLCAAKGETPSQAVTTEHDRTIWQHSQLVSAHREAVSKIADAARQTPPTATVAVATVNTAHTPTPEKLNPSEAFQRGKDRALAAYQAAREQDALSVNIAHTSTPTPPFKPKPGHTTFAAPLRYRTAQSQATGIRMWTGRVAAEDKRIHDLRDEIDTIINRDNGHGAGTHERCAPIHNRINQAQAARQEATTKLAWVKAQTPPNAPAANPTKPTPKPAPKPAPQRQRGSDRRFFPEPLRYRTTDTQAKGTRMWVARIAQQDERLKALRGEIETAVSRDGGHNSPAFAQANRRIERQIHAAEVARHEADLKRAYVQGQHPPKPADTTPTPPNTTQTISKEERAALRAWGERIAKMST